MEHARDLAGGRTAIAESAAALRGLRSFLYQCPSAQLGDLAGEIAELRALAGAALAATAAEAESRGVIAESHHASTRSWVAETAWHSRREASTIAKTAGLLRRAELAPLAESLFGTDVDPATAVAVGAEFDKLAPDLRPEARPVVLEKFVAIGAERGPAAVRQLKEHLLARYGKEGEFEDFEEHCRRHIDLPMPHQNAAGLWDYRLTLDNVGYAVLEAAIGPGSAPKPDPQTGERDARPTGRRRGEALITALQRAQTASSHVPTSPKASVMVTIAHADLVRRLRARRCVGSGRCDSNRMGNGHVHGESASDGHITGGTINSGNTTGGHVNSGAVDDGYTVGESTDGEHSDRGDGHVGIASADAGPAGCAGIDGACTHSGGTRSGCIEGSVCGSGTGTGTVLGSLAAGTELSAATVRTLACDAAIIPAVLGSAGEVLDQGRAVRLFTPGQVRALWYRDRHCTFAGCDIPAAWCDAHHLVHWADGGPTDLDNAALLCARHHTIVHRDRLAGRVGRETGTGRSAQETERVIWDRRPGSYQGYPGTGRTGRLHEHEAAEPPNHPDRSASSSARAERRVPPPRSQPLTGSAILRT